MPLYEYECTKCHRRTEKIENVSGPHLKKCPHCGGKVESVWTAPAIQFKGSGWYVTDYAGKKSTGGDSAPAAKADAAETKESVAKNRPRKKAKTKRPARKKTESASESQDDGPPARCQFSNQQVVPHKLQAQLDALAVVRSTDCRLLRSAKPMYTRTLAIGFPRRQFRGNSLTGCNAA